MKKSYLFCLLFAVVTSFARAQTTSTQVYINEIMPSNINGILDDRYDFPDSWVELYNATESEIDMQGWYLSDDKDDLTQWKIPVSCKIPAKGYKLLYLDTENTKLHANFRLDIKGGDLYLVDPDGSTIHNTVCYEKQDPNISYGRVTDGANEYGWFLTPTPGSSNQTLYTKDKKEIVPSVSFLPEGGIYTQSTTVKLFPKKENETFSNYIYYTTDGTEPTEQSYHYTEPFTIDTTTIIRAKIIHKDYLQKLSVTQSYIYPQRELTLPVFSLVTDPDYLWDDTIGIYTERKNGAYFKTDNIKGYFNWAQDWRRPVNVEYFVQGENKINQVGEMRIMGGLSREKAQKSLAVYANKRFGEKRFDYAFFQEKKPLDDGYKSIMLRNSGQDFNHTFMRDAVNHYTGAGKMDLDYQAYQPTIVFLNGVYWGIHNLRERSNDHHILSNYDTEDIDMLENNELKAGDMNNFNELYALISSGNYTYEDLEKYLDIEETLNYIILETFVANYDWPNNNVVFWRKRNNGKWRWLLKDTDYCLSGHNIFTNIYTKKAPLSMIIRACLDNETFREQFIDRYTVYLGDFFKKDITTALVDSFTTQIKAEMEYARPRWNLSVDTWNSKVASLRREMLSRPNAMYGHLQSFFQQSKTIPATISTTSEYHNPNEGLVINQIPLQDKSFNGRFFCNRQIDIKLADASQNADFKYWLITKTGGGNKKTTQISTDRNLSFCLDTTIQALDVKAFISKTIPAFEIKNNVLTFLSDITDENYTILYKICADLQSTITAVDMTEVNYKTSLSVDSLLSKLNANRLVYTNENLEGTNIICQSLAKEIILSDSLPFKCPKEFETEKISFTRHKYQIAETRWTDKAYYPLLLPFDLEVEERPENMSILVLEESNFATSSEKLNANTPYLCLWTDKSSDSTFTIESFNKKIPETPVSLIYKGKEVQFIGNFDIEVEAQEGYFINTQNSEIGKLGKSFIRTKKSPAPFEVFLKSENGLPDIFPIITGPVANQTITVNPDLNIQTVSNGVKVSSSKSRPIAIYTIDGKLFKTINLIENNEVFITLPTGIFVIDKQKVVIL